MHQSSSRPSRNCARGPGHITISDRNASDHFAKLDLVMGPGLRRDDEKYSRGAMRPKFCISLALSEIRGRREDRVRAAPAVSQAVCK